MDETRWRETVDRVRRIRHDANSPITAALGHVQLLLDDPAVTDPEVKESLEVVENQLKRLMDILAELKTVRYE
ncbi:MAG TPA: histidine kinase dimerization/phospho-acceptor domain-containing protein [Longimicrobiales bacterium]|nr:histidine kinase dimerization/phospho-acceptor domain-containing protein [Longimicrobiales bacterium]